MDGMFHLAAHVPARSGPVLGILYAEDFDAPDEALQPDGPLPADPADVPLTPADVEAACAAAVRGARSEWEQSDLHARTQALGTLAAGIADARTAARAAAEAVADGVARTMLSMLAGALPGFCAAHGDAEARALLRHVLPALAQEPRVTVRVHPGLVAGVQQDVALLDEDLAERINVLPAALEPGDVRVAWTDGALSRDTKALLTAMQDALAELGLLDPSLIANGLVTPSLITNGLVTNDPTTNRRMALAN